MTTINASQMSWGPATVFIHRRLRFDGLPVGPVRLNRLPSDKDYNGDDSLSIDDLNLGGSITVETNDSDDDGDHQPAGNKGTDSSQAPLSKTITSIS